MASFDLPGIVLKIPVAGPQGPAGPGSFTPTVVLDDGATISVDITTGDNFAVVLGGDRTINLVGGSANLNGKKIILRIIQDDTGSRLVTWGSMVRFGTDIPLVTLSLNANKSDLAGFIYNHAASKFDLVAFTKGY